MTCQELQTDLQAYLDGELTPVRRALIEKHLSECSECREMLAELRTVSGALAGWSEHKVSTNEQLALLTKLSAEDTAAKGRRAASRPIASRGGSLPAAYPISGKALLRWVASGWRPAAVAALVLASATAYFTVGTGTAPRRNAVRTRIDVLPALSAASSGGQIADGCVYADLVGRRAVASAVLDAPRVASCDVVTAFLATVDSESDKTVGRKLLNLLAGSAHRQQGRPVTIASIAGALVPLGRDAYAMQAVIDPLLSARQYELQGRFREALLKYQELSAGGSERAMLAEGALDLRMGDVDAAQAVLAKAAAGKDKTTAASAQALLVEVAGARNARVQAQAAKSTAVSAAEWHKVALLEVEGCDYRAAANSFMQAASAAGDSQSEIARDARFRSAWCQKEVGQLSTGIYGFKAVFDEADSPQKLSYAAGIEQAVCLARIGRFRESVDTCKAVVKRPAGDPEMEALAYFQKGCVELRSLKDAKSAGESLGIVSASGQGNLSYAALVLLQTAPK